MLDFQRLMLVLFFAQQRAHIVEQGLQVQPRTYKSGYFCRSIYHISAWHPYCSCFGVLRTVTYYPRMIQGTVAIAIVQHQVMIIQGTRAR